MTYITTFKGTFGLSRRLTLIEAREYMDTVYKVYNDKLGWLHWVPTTCLDSFRLGCDSIEVNDTWSLVIVLKWLSKKGIYANGIISWQGEDIDDIGELRVRNNILTVSKLPYLEKCKNVPLTEQYLIELEAKAWREHALKTEAINVHNT